MKRGFLRDMILGAIVACMLIAQPISVKAAGAASLSTGSASVMTGQTFDVAIHQDSGAEPVNVVRADVSYDASKLQFVAVNAAGSAFDGSASQSGGAGRVVISRFVSGGATVSGRVLVAYVTLKALDTPGATRLSFGASSAIYRSTDNTNIWNGMAGGSTITINAPAPSPGPAAPQPTPQTPAPTPAASPTPTPVGRTMPAPAAPAPRPGASPAPVVAAPVPGAQVLDTAQAGPAVLGATTQNGPSAQEPTSQAGPVIAQAQTDPSSLRSLRLAGAVLGAVILAASAYMLMRPKRAKAPVRAERPARKR